MLFKLLSSETPYGQWGLFLMWPRGSAGMGPGCVTDGLGGRGARDVPARSALTGRGALEFRAVCWFGSAAGRGRPALQRSRTSHHRPIASDDLLQPFGDLAQ